MTDDKLKKLRVYYHLSFSPKAPASFPGGPGRLCAPAVARVFQDELQRIEADFKGLVPQLDMRAHILSSDQGLFDSCVKVHGTNEEIRASWR